MGFPYTEVSPVLRSLQSSPVSVPLYNNLWLTSLSPCVCVWVCVCVCVCVCLCVCFRTRNLSLEPSTNFTTSKLRGRVTLSEEVCMMFPRSTVFLPQLGRAPQGHSMLHNTATETRNVRRTWQTPAFDEEQTYKPESCIVKCGRALKHCHFGALQREGSTRLCSFPFLKRKSGGLAAHTEVSLFAYCLSTSPLKRSTE